MIVGFPPFYADTPNETCRKIVNWKKYLSFPSSVNISRDAIDLILNLITDVDKRLGYHGADEVKAHPFFKGIDWKNIRRLNPPFVPKLENPWDCRNFDKFEEAAANEEIKKPTQRQTSNQSPPKQVKKDVCFVDFTYKKEVNENHNLINAIEIMDDIKKSFKEMTEEIQKDKKKELQMKESVQQASKAKYIGSDNTKVMSNSITREFVINTTNLQHKENNTDSGNLKRFITNPGDSAVGTIKVTSKPRFFNLTPSHEPNKAIPCKKETIAVADTVIIKKPTKLIKERNNVGPNIPGILCGRDNNQVVNGSFNNSEEKDKEAKGGNGSCSITKSSSSSLKNLSTSNSPCPQQQVSFAKFISSKVKMPPTLKKPYTKFDMGKAPQLPRPVNNENLQIQINTLVSPNLKGMNILTQNAVKKTMISSETPGRNTILKIKYVSCEKSK